MRIAGGVLKKGHYGVVGLFLENPGVHDFCTAGGRGTSQIDSQPVAITFGPRGKIKGAVPSGRVGCHRWCGLFLVDGDSPPIPHQRRGIL